MIVILLWPLWATVASYIKVLFQFFFKLSQGTADDLKKVPQKPCFQDLQECNLGFVEFGGLISHEGTFNFYHGS